jgi:hypothetical protein
MNSLDYCEFYITNVCNLSCEGCNRFNNFSFKGYQRWEDYSDIYRQWSKKIDLKSIAILGGEPLLNPTFMAWIKGLTDLWPRAYFRIISNGYHLNKVNGFYDFLKSNPRCSLWIGLHNKQKKKFISNQLLSFLEGPCIVEFNNDNPYQEFLIYKDQNGVSVRIEYNWWFHQGALIKNDLGLGLHNSDPIKAHDICNMKSCHHFIKGKLYKCGVAALLPEFDQQNTLSLSSEDRELMMSYRPLDIDSNDDILDKFIKELGKPIPQCRFCPESYQGKQIFAIEKNHDR